MLTDKNGPVKPLEIELWAHSGDKQTELIAAGGGAGLGADRVKTEQKFEDISTICGPEGYQFTEAMTAGLYSWYNSSDPDNTWYWSSQYIPETPTGAGGNVQCYLLPLQFPGTRSTPSSTRQWRSSIRTSARRRISRPRSCSTSRRR